VGSAVFAAFANSAAKKESGGDDVHCLELIQGTKCIFQGKQSRAYNYR